MPPEPDTNPHSFYVVFAAPRTGSTLLCNLLRGTGVAGRPTEYFFPRAQVNLAQRWGVTDPYEYLARVRRQGTTPNGVFGVKIVFTYLEEVLAGLRDLFDADSLNDAQVLDHLYPGLRYTWVYRDDLVAQGVSWAKARMTNEWIVDDPRGWDHSMPVFDFGLIHEFVWRATRLQMLMRRWFAYHGIQPFLVRYEDLAADPDGLTRGLLRYLGIEPPEEPIEPSMERQGDSLNAEWAARYRELARTLPPGFPALTDPLPRELTPT